MEECQYMISMKQLGFFYEKDDFSVSDTGDSEEKKTSFLKGRFRRYDFSLHG